MNTYADTSFFFSLYATDANSAKADTWRQAHPLPLPFTTFHRVELRNAFSLAVFQKRLAPQEVQSAWQELENDLATSPPGCWCRVAAYGTEFFSKPRVLRKAIHHPPEVARWMSSMSLPPNCWPRRNSVVLTRAKPLSPAGLV